MVFQSTIAYKINAMEKSLEAGNKYTPSTKMKISKILGIDFKTRTDLEGL
jgi:hypothetical protein